MADRKISDLTALTTPAAGDYLPIVDISEVAAASKNKRITIEELFRGTPDGTAAAPAIAPESDPNTGIYSSGADQLSIATNGTERLRIDSAGQIEAVSLGTAAAPTFSFTGDPNTGIYSPGADQLAISTNGTGRLFVDASGNVTFGVNGNTAITAGTAITLARYTGTTLHSLWKTGNVSAGLVLYQTVGPASGGDSVERLRATISSASGTYQRGLSWQDDSGNLNLAFNAAQGRFEVGNTSIGTGTFTTVPASGTNVAGPNVVIAGGQSTGTGAGGSILFNTASAGGSGTSVNALTERMRLTSAGLLGLGTSSPSKRLTIVQDGADSALRIEQSGEGYNIYRNQVNGHLYFDASQQTFSGYNFSVIPTGGSLTSALFISNAARVGIGTTSPGSRLTVNDTTNAHVQLGFNDLFYGRVGRNNAGAYEFSSFENGAPLTFGTTGTTGSTTERARIDASGRLLVGTSSARDKYFNSSSFALPVQFETATTGARGLSVVNNSGTDTSYGSFFVLGRSAGSAVNTYNAVSANYKIGAVSYQAADGTELVEAARIEAEVDGTPGANDMPGRLVFSTTADGASSPTARMYITSSGNVSIGTTNPENFGGITLRKFGSTDSALWINATSTSQKYAQFEYNGSPIGTISTNGSAVAYNTTSDYRLKENVVPLTGAIDRVNDLQVHRFNFIANPGKIVDGFIAHEAQAVVPECVTGTKDEVDDEGNPVYQGIDQSKLVPLLTAALQEAIGEIESLKARVAALEGA